MFGTKKTKKIDFSQMPDPVLESIKQQVEQEHTEPEPETVKEETKSKKKPETAEDESEEELNFDEIKVVDVLPVQTVRTVEQNGKKYLFITKEEAAIAKIIQKVSNSQ